MFLSGQVSQTDTRLFAREWMVCTDQFENVEPETKNELENNKV